LEKKIEEEEKANPKVLSPMGEEVPASLSALIGFE
jgi:hypothetical protein